MPKANDKITIIRDRREHEGQGWFFDENDWCAGTEPGTLKTGDYSIVGYEDRFCIERKRNTAELATNLFEDRFYRELERLRSFEMQFLLLEFSISDILQYPVNSGVPRNRWDRLKMTPPLFLKKFLEVQIEYPNLKILFVENRGRDVAASLFKRVIEHYAKAEDGK